MKAGLFKKVKPNRGEYCKVVYIHRQQKFTEDCVKFNGFDKHGNAYFATENWASDILLLDVSKILFIKAKEL